MVLLVRKKFPRNFLENSYFFFRFFIQIAQTFEQRMQQYNVLIQYMENYLQSPNKMFTPKSKLFEFSKNFLYFSRKTNKKILLRI